MNETVQTRSYPGTNIGNVVLGIWVAISPWVLGYSSLEAAKWNDLAVGLAVMLVALGQGPFAKGGRMLNALLGAWLIASPFVLNFTAPLPFWNNIILGIVNLIVWLVAAGDTTARTAAHEPESPMP